MKLVALLSLLAVSTVQAQNPISSLSTDNVDVQNAIIDTHNYYRRNAQPTASNMLRMVWNNKAAENAGVWAQQCKGAHSPPEYRQIPGFECGENLLFASFPMSWEEVIYHWHSERENFQYGTGAIDSDKETGHYTQIVWYNSCYLGCAVAKCDSGYSYVCQYCPAGNDMNSLNPYKSGQPCADCEGFCSDNLCTNL